MAGNNSAVKSENYLSDVYCAGYSAHRITVARLFKRHNGLLRFLYSFWYSLLSNISHTSNCDIYKLKDIFNGQSLHFECDALTSEIETPSSVNSYSILIMPGLKLYTSTSKIHF